MPAKAFACFFVTIFYTLYESRLLTQGGTILTIKFLTLSKFIVQINDVSTNYRIINPDKSIMLYQEQFDAYLTPFDTVVGIYIKIYHIVYDIQ